MMAGARVEWSQAQAQATSLEWRGVALTARGVAYHELDVRAGLTICGRRVARMVLFPGLAGSAAPCLNCYPELRKIRRAVT